MILLSDSGQQKKSGNTMILVVFGIILVCIIAGVLTLVLKKDWFAIVKTWFGNSLQEQAKCTTTDDDETLLKIIQDEAKCPVDCVGSWSGWSTCYSNNKQSNTFTVTTPASDGGTPCPSPLNVYRDCTTTGGGTTTGGTTTGGGTSGGTTTLTNLSGKLYHRGVHSLSFSDTIRGVGQYFTTNFNFQYSPTGSNTIFLTRDQSLGNSTYTISNDQTLLTSITSISDFFILDEPAPEQINLTNFTYVGEVGDRLLQFTTMMDVNFRLTETTWSTYKYRTIRKNKIELYKTESDDKLIISILPDKTKLSLDSIMYTKT